jgi:peptidoglycan DL-endopeptidase CwlO
MGRCVADRKESITMRDPRRWWVFAAAVLLGLIGGGLSTGVAAAEDDAPAGLMAQLDAATRGYVEANAKLEASKARQAELNAQLADVQTKFEGQSEAVAAIAASAYRTAGLTSHATAGIFAAGTPDTFLDRVTLLNALAMHENASVQRLANTRDQANAAKTAIDAEIEAQQAQANEMAARKQQAEQALWASGGGAASGGFNGSSSAVAEPAPRNADGSWPAESCSVYEDVTGGCITPRMAHARDQAQAAGFDHYVSCYRSVNDGGEHPQGRACDFAAAVNGFGGAAVGDERTYGNNLAAFFINNANQLAVLYVIWYRQIWLPGSGWRAYSGSGSPSAEHTNHVHLSVY